MTINLSSLIHSGGGGGGLPQLAPDLTYPSSPTTGSVTYQVITGINGTGGLTTALSLTGKYAVMFLEFLSVVAENVTIKLTIDGVVIWNENFTSSSSIALFGNNSGANAGPNEILQCETSLLLEIQTTTDTSVQLNYLARPIL